MKLKSQPQHIEAFEASLGPSLKSLGHITDTTRHLTCLDNVIDTSAIAQYLPPCLPCVEVRTPLIVNVKV